MDTTFATRVTAEQARADERLGLVAYAQAIVGVVGIATLALMYAIEVPRGGPFVFGSINDVTGALFSALFVPLILRLRQALPRGDRMDRLTVVAVAASGAGIVLPLLLVAGAISFEAQLPMVLAAFELQSVWLFVAGRKLARTAAVPRRFARFTQLVGGSFIAGSVVALPALLLPAGSIPQLGILAIAGVLAGGAWAAWPLWSAAVGRALRSGLPPVATPSA